MPFFISGERCTPKHHPHFSSASSSLDPNSDTSQIALWRRLEGKEAESIKESKKRIQELEVSLATARSHAIELEERVAELEESVARVEKEKLRAEKNNSRLEGEKDGLEKVKERLEGDKGRLEKELKRWKKSVKEEGSEKENTPEDKKGKKRSREEEHDKLRATKKVHLFFNLSRSLRLTNPS